MSVSTLIAYVTEFPSIPLGIACFILLLYTAYLHHKMYRFTKGKNGSSLEDIITLCVDSTKKIEEVNEEIKKHAQILNNKTSHALRNVKTIRYKAFDQNGSNQSFSISLVNERGNGVIITTLHAHERISTFAKPIENYKSPYELTEEEQHVLEESRKEHIS
jgi:hypothetical protein